MATSLRYEPDYAVAPGRSLRSTLAERGLTQADLAERTGLSLKHVNQIAQGVAPITPETALLFERVTDVPARRWNALEVKYREKLARDENRDRLAGETDWLTELPLKELINRGYVEARAAKPKQVEQACRFFGVADPERWRQVWLAQLTPLVSFRQSASFAADAGAVATWLRLGELEAIEIPTKPFDAKRFRTALAKARSLTLLEPRVALERLKKLCADAGVAVVFLSDIGGTRAGGAARWLTPQKALIQLSDRGKAEDRFWFTFFHEAAHLLLHSKKELFVSDDDVLNATEKREQEANAFAATQLIPRPHEADLGRLRTDADVVDFAEQLGIAPGIVVGRLHNEKKWDWKRGNRLIRRVSFADLFGG
jgi:HTH-type transcriptional regulator/antitoxin HigA